MRNYYRRNRYLYESVQGHTAQLTHDALFQVIDSIEDFMDKTYLSFGRHMRPDQRKVDPIWVFIDRSGSMPYRSDVMANFLAALDDLNTEYGNIIVKYFASGMSDTDGAHLGASSNYSVIANAIASEDIQNIVVITDDDVCYESIKLRVPGRAWGVIISHDHQANNCAFVFGDEGTDLYCFYDMNDRFSGSQLSRFDGPRESPRKLAPNYQPYGLYNPSSRMESYRRYNSKKKH